MKKIEMLKQLLAAVSIKEIIDLLATENRKPSKTLGSELHDVKNRNGVKIFLAVMAMLSIVIVTYLAFIGGAYINEYTGPIALIFGVLDLSIVIILLLNVVKGKFRYIMLLFEICSLCYLGYAVGGYYGGGNLRSVAEKKLSDSYTVAKEHFTDAKKTAELLTRTTSNAQNVANVESQRDGKGVVFEKATFIAQMKAEALKPLPNFPKSPNFKNLAEGNKWLETERQKVADILNGYDAANSAMIDQAKSTEASLKSSMITTLSENQKSNLQVLIASVDGIGKREISKSKISNMVLTPSDLKADGFQSYIGFIIDFVIIFFILMLVLQKNKVDENMIETAKREEAQSLIAEILEEKGIYYDSSVLSKVTIEKQYEILRRIETNEELLKYLKNRVSFDDYVLFSIEHPQVAQKLNHTGWSITQIRKELTNDSNFLENAEQALEMSPSDWESLKSIIGNINLFFLMEENERKEFLTLLKNLQIKGKFKKDDLKIFAIQFLSNTQEKSEDFIEILSICVDKIKNSEVLKELNPNFINCLTKETAKFLCMTHTHEKKFIKLINSWSEPLNKSLSEILSVLEEENGFTRFMEIIFNQGGIDAFKKVSRVYETRQAEINVNTFGNKTITLKPDFTLIADAIEKSNDQAFLKQIEEAFQVKNSLN